jgi:AmmeMemoRadiSam system protein A
MLERAPDDISPPALARLSVERFITKGADTFPPLSPAGVLAEHAGAFVTLRDEEGNLRGCIGTIEPARSNVAEEIIHNAISAATLDPRFEPVTADELSRLRYGVDVLSPIERARGIEDLDPSVYGVILEAREGPRRAVLLPGIEGIETAEQQWQAVHQKAGLRIGVPVRVYRFTVRRFGKD